MALQQVCVEVQCTAKGLEEATGFRAAHWCVEDGKLVLGLGRMVLMVCCWPADACLLAIGGDLVLVGGSKGRYRYADEPSKAWFLRKGARR